MWKPGGEFELHPAESIRVPKLSDSCFPCATRVAAANLMTNGRIGWPMRSLLTWRTKISVGWGTYRAGAIFLKVSHGHPLDLEV